ncbi:hypothetical protein LTR85_003715 [Meristemomyces frigidus]|nr:hypothetical protein LTR85_003715 [Meristemomyces frigidus]
MTQTYTFSPVTATDRAGIVWVAAILSLMFSILTLVTRFLIKFHALGLDDWCIAASTLLAIGQYIAVYLGLSDGVGISSMLLGKHHARTLGGSVMASEILFVLSLGLCKLARWTAVITTDALLEVLYVALAIILVHPLQMKTSVKATVVFAFAFRLISAVLAAMHGLSIAKYVHSADPGLAIANVLVWQQVELGYALISSTVPTLKSFIRGYNKAMGWDPTYDSKRGALGGGYNLETYGQHSGARSAQASAVGAGALRSKGGGVPSRLRREPDDDAIELRSKTDGAYHAGAYHESSHRGHGNGKGVRRMTSTGSGDSEDPIIRRDILVTVEHERTSINV